MFLTKKAWPPYAAGIVIGLLQIPALHYRNRAWCFFLLRHRWRIDRFLARASPMIAAMFVGGTHPSYYAGTVPALALGFRTRLRRLHRVAERATGCGGIAVGGLGAPEGTWE